MADLGCQTFFISDNFKTLQRVIFWVSKNAGCRHGSNFIQTLDKNYKFQK